MKACVVGAGFAGLAAAEDMRRTGIDVTVLEARERVGGRVWSQVIANGSTIERGAEYLDLEQTTLVGIVARMGLRLAPAGVSFTDREPRGGVGTTRTEVQESVARVLRLLAASPQRIFTDSATNVLKDAPISPGAREAIASRLQITHAYPVEDLTAGALLNVGFSSAEGLRVAGGNQRIALALAARLGSDVRLSRVVDHIAWSSTGASVHATSGDTFDCDACVVAVPASVLPRITFDPPLPGWKISANREVRYGHAAKLYVPLETIPPASAVMSVPDRYWSYTANGANGIVQPVVTCFAGSMAAVEALDALNGPDRWVRRLKDLRPDLKLDSTAALISTWSRDPLILGAYPARSWRDRLDLGDSLARPVGPLHFCGDHIGLEGGMNVALESGVRASREIILKESQRLPLS